MPKDVKKNHYLNAAVPKTSRLLQRIEEVHQETNLPDSQILVFFAAEYVRMMESQGSISIGVAPPATNLIQGSAITPTSVDVVASIGASDEDLDAYGVPD